MYHILYFPSFSSYHTPSLKGVANAAPFVPVFSQSCSGVSQAIKITNRRVKHKRFRQKEAAARRFRRKILQGRHVTRTKPIPASAQQTIFAQRRQFLHICHGRQPQTGTPAVSDTFPERTRLRFRQNLAGHASEIAGKSLV